MGTTTFKMVAAGDGSPQSPSGYRYYVLAHAIATVLLPIVLVTAIWEFMDWVVAPSCLGDASLSVSSSVTPSQHYSARAESALGDGDCPCPHER
jgi:hypothetical protein